MRKLIKIKLVIAAIIIPSFLVLAQEDSKIDKLRVNQDRIEDRIMELANFGRDSLGRNYRVAYSKGDIEGRQWFMDKMVEAGLEVRIDEAGNIIGKRKGENSSLKPIAFGSHIDMVPDGGNYDGCVGSISGLEVMQILHENDIYTEHPLELYIFSDEEGSLLGSKAIAGHVNEDRLDFISHSGLNLRDGIKAIGGDPTNIINAKKNKGYYLAFLELHIEQGGILEEENLDIGVVEGIVGIEQWDVTVKGFANHSGTTPMDMRQDAMLSAAKLIVAINDVITSHDGKQVGTVGKISVKPGAYNVIPSEVVFGLEIRDLSHDKIQMLFEEIKYRAKEISEKNNTSISFEDKKLGVIPAMASETIQQKIEVSAKKLGLSYKYMPSGAGHDAQDMAMVAPMGMIFVPSVNGISHSPKEFTTPEDMANGANVLLHTILLVDKDK